MVGSGAGRERPRPGRHVQVGGDGHGRSEGRLRTWCLGHSELGDFEPLTCNHEVLNRKYENTIYSAQALNAISPRVLKAGVGLWGTQSSRVMFTTMRDMTGQ